MRNKIIFFFIFLFCIASALGFNVSVVPDNVMFQSGSSFVGNFSVENFGVEVLYNFFCEDVGVVDFGSIPIVNGSSTVVLPFSVFSGSEFSDTYSTVCGFDVRVPLVGSPQNYSLNFSGSWSSGDVWLRQDDFLNVSNFDVINHTFSDFNDTFDFLLLPGGSQVVSFVNVSDRRFYDKVSGFSGWVHVLNKSVEHFVHDSDNDLNISFGVQAFFGNSSVELDVLTSFLEVEVFGSKEGVLKLKNVGFNDALGVSLSGLWTTFENESFVLSPGEEFFMSFFVSPNVSLSEDTNRTYDIPLEVCGTNFLCVSRNVSVFVPFRNFSGLAVGGNGSVVYVVNIPATIKYCADNPDSSECSPLLENRTVERVVEKPCFFSVNYTSEELEDLKINSLEGVRRVINNQDKNGLVCSNAQSVIEGFNFTTLNRSLVLEFENSKLRDDNSNLWILFFGIILLSAGGVLFFKGLRDKLKKDSEVREI